tara:strand:- start:1889 stop:2110 length:222 start_codon:yes stop_codon:yes gene_type:complete
MEIAAFVRWLKNKRDLDYCVFKEREGKIVLEVVAGAFMYGVLGKTYEEAIQNFIKWHNRKSKKMRKAKAQKKS